jgi:hypothetical protein
MAKLLYMPFACRLKFLNILCLIAAGCGCAWDSAADAQNTYAGCCPPYTTRDVTRPRITYGGRIYLAFPNYDVFLGGAPTRLEDLATGQGVADARVIYRNEQGMRWDGNEFFLHPAYPVEQITKYRIYNRVVGEGVTAWPQSYTTGTYPSAGPTTVYQTAYPTVTYQTVYPTSYPETYQLHSPMPNTVRFRGNAWGYEPELDPAATAPIYESPGAIIVQPETPATGRTTKPQ